MSSVHKTRSEIEIVTITEASFDDLATIGLDVLALRDATVVEKLLLPGYEDYLGRIAAKASVCKLGPDSEELVKVIKDDPITADIQAGYQSLVGGDIFRHPIVAETGRSAKEVRGQGYPTLRPHIDTNINSQDRVTANTTLYTAKEGWSWGLSSLTAMHERDMVALEAEARVPLIAGGLVLLGEKARLNNLGKDCTPVHEVIAPEASWGSEYIQRIRIASTKR